MICSNNCYFKPQEKTCLDDCQLPKLKTERLCVDSCDDLELYQQVNFCVQKCNKRFELQEKQCILKPNEQLDKPQKIPQTELQMRQAYNIAEQVFRKRYNCAQTVAYAGNDGKETEIVRQSRRYGGGNAPGGICGAFYTVIAMRPDLEDIVLNDALKQFGSITCAGIRSSGKVNCEQCVLFGVKLLKQYGLE